MSTTDIPAFPPSQFVAGETVVFTRTLDDYPAPDWTLKYHLRGPGGSLDATAAAFDSAHKVTIPATVTSPLEAGTYYWQLWVEQDAERRMVASGEVRVLPGLNAVIENFDGRSRAKKILDAIDATLAGRAATDQQQYQISGGGGYRMLMHIPVAELVALRREYARIYAREQRRARVRRGGSLFANVKVRFDRPK